MARCSENVAQTTKKLHEACASEHHPNVLMMYGVTLQRGMLSTVTEVMVLRGIDDWVWHTDTHGNANKGSRYKELRPADAVQLALDAATGLAHMEANGFAHRDVACRNVFCTATLDDGGKLQRGVDGRIVGLRGCIADCESLPAELVALHSRRRTTVANSTMPLSLSWCLLHHACSCRPRTTRLSVYESKQHFSGVDGEQINL